MRKIELSSERDDLTGVFNRGSFNRDVAKLKGENRPYSLAMIDVDQFKFYNDHYGHLAGDRVLQIIARCLSDNAGRSGDPVYRYGGEEFVLLMQDTDLAGAAAVLERCRAAIEALAMPHAHRDDDCQLITISAGVAEVGEAQLHEVLEIADRRLYASKAAGRNRVIARGDQTP